MRFRLRISSRILILPWPSREFGAGKHKRATNSFSVRATVASHFFFLLAFRVTRSAAHWAALPLGPMAHAARAARGHIGGQSCRLPELWLNLPSDIVVKSSLVALIVWHHRNSASLRLEVSAMCRAGPGVGAGSAVGNRAERTCMLHAASEG